MDALLPIDHHARAYARAVREETRDGHGKGSDDGHGKGSDKNGPAYRLYEVQNGNHIETFQDDLHPARVSSSRTPSGRSTSWSRTSSPAPTCRPTSASRAVVASADHRAARSLPEPLPALSSGGQPRAAPRLSCWRGAEAVGGDLPAALHGRPRWRGAEGAAGGAAVPTPGLLGARKGRLRTHGRAVSPRWGSRLTGRLSSRGHARVGLVPRARRTDTVPGLPGPRAGRHGRSGDESGADDGASWGRGRAQRPSVDEPRPGAASGRSGGVREDNRPAPRPGGEARAGRRTSGRRAD